MTRVAFALLATFVAGSAAAQLYRWVDAEGKVHYTDQPPANARSVETHKATANVVTSTAPFAVQQATKNFPVKIYTGTNCGSPCSDARDLLGKRGVPFAEVSVTQPAQLDELKKVSGGEEVPIVLVGRAVLKGFEPTSLNAALDNAGYPRNAGRTPVPPAAKTPSGPPSAGPAAVAGAKALAPGDALAPGAAQPSGATPETKSGSQQAAQSDPGTAAKGPYAPR
jgi:glutaredoxin